MSGWRDFHRPITGPITDNELTFNCSSPVYECRAIPCSGTVQKDSALFNAFSLGLFSFKVCNLGFSCPKKDYCTMARFAKSNISLLIFLNQFNLFLCGAFRKSHPRMPDMDVLWCTTISFIQNDTGKRGKKTFKKCLHADFTCICGSVCPCRRNFW